MGERVGEETMAEEGKSRVRRTCFDVCPEENFSFSRDSCSELLRGFMRTTTIYAHTATVSH